MGRVVSVAAGFMWVERRPHDLTIAMVNDGDMARLESFSKDFETSHPSIRLTEMGHSSAKHSAPARDNGMWPSVEGNMMSSRLGL